MLLNLHVMNLALIKEADIYFDKGLNILTGETGAGKSIMIGSVNIALGGKIPKDMIREDAPYALVELIFELGSKERQLLMDYDIIIPEEEQLVISRKIVNGRSSVKINGESVSLSILRNITSNLIDIHGQHEHQSLLYKAKHLEILDQFSGQKINKIKKEVKTDYENLKALEKHALDFDMDEEERLRECSFLEFAINEIKEANILEGEDVELEALFKKMSNARKIAEVLSGVYQNLNDEMGQGITDQISRASKDVNDIVEYDSDLGSIAGQLIDLDSICQDLSRDIQSYIHNMSYDEEEVMYTQQRLDLINNLKAKYGNTIEGIYKYKKEKENELDGLKNYDEAKQKLQKEITFCCRTLKEKAENLSKIRKTQAKKLQKEIIFALKELNFLDVKFEIVFNEIQEIGAKGMDEIEFMISTNPGESVKSLSKVASGGELSRVMLAIKTILAGVLDINTLIFDEIDTGISGRTAQMVSEKLAVLGKSNQIICITHLPQIAAMADRHFLIEKNVEKKNSRISNTVTSINEIREDKIIEELARLLGGVQITDTVLRNAHEMKELAEQTKLYQA